MTSEAGDHIATLGALPTAPDRVAQAAHALGHRRRRASLRPLPFRTMTDVSERGEAGAAVAVRSVAATGLGFGFATGASTLLASAAFVHVLRDRLGQQADSDEQDEHDE